MPLIFPDANVRQHRQNRRICHELVCWVAAGAPCGPPDMFGGDSTEAMLVDLHAAALAGKVVLASSSRLTALTCSSLNGTTEAVHECFTFEHKLVIFELPFLRLIAIWIKDDNISRITQITYEPNMPCTSFCP